MSGPLVPVLSEPTEFSSGALTAVPNRSPPPIVAELPVRVLFCRISELVGKMNMAPPALPPMMSAIVVLWTAKIVPPT